MGSSVDNTFFGTKVFLITAMAFALAVLHLLVVFVFNPNGPRAAQNGGTETPASLNALVSGCGGFFHWAPTEDNALVVPDDQVGNVERIAVADFTTVQTYGYMGEQGLPRLGFWDDSEENLPSQFQTNRHLYDGGTIIWYAPTIDPADKQLLQDLAEERAGQNLAVLPWDGQRPLPFDRQVAFASWGATQSCAFWDEVSFGEYEDFVAELALARPNLKVVDVPESGVLPPLPRAGVNGQ